jgi:hypothetical protein
LVFDSSLEHQHSTLRNFSWRWFGPYVVVATHDNATYTLCELNGTMLKIPMILQTLKLERTMKWKKQIQRQVKMATWMNTKKIETWYIPEDVQV